MITQGEIGPIIREAIVDHRIGIRVLPAVFMLTVSQRKRQYQEERQGHAGDKYPFR